MNEHVEGNFGGDLRSYVPGESSFTVRMES